MLLCPNCKHEFLDDEKTTWKEEIRKPIREALRGHSVVGHEVTVQWKARCPHCNNVWVYSEYVKEGKVMQVIEQAINMPANIWKAAWKKLWRSIFG